MKTILVPTDFSKNSSNAINYAAEIAKLSKAELVLMHIYYIPVVTADAPVVMPAWSDIEKDCLAALKKTARSIHAKYGKSLAIKCVCRMGFAVDETIKQYTEEKKIDMVIMGMHGAGYLTEKLIGSNTSALIKKSDCPVMVINEHVKFKKIKKIILACDYEKIPGKPVFNILKKFVTLFKSEVFVLHVINENKKIAASKETIINKEIIKSLKGADVSFCFIENDNTISGINEFAAEKKADMIVIIPRVHNFLDRVFKESNTKRMVFHSSIPLLALH